MANDLATAYIQILPSLRNFDTEIRNAINQAGSTAVTAGAQAGRKYSQAFQAEVKKIKVDPAAGAAGGMPRPGPLPCRCCCRAGCGRRTASLSARSSNATLAKLGSAGGAAAAAGVAAGLSSVGDKYKLRGSRSQRESPSRLAAIGVGSAKAAISFESRSPASARRSTPPKQSSLRLEESHQEHGEQTPFSSRVVGVHR